MEVHLIESLATFETRQGFFVSVHGTGGNCLNRNVLVLKMDEGGNPGSLRMIRLNHGVC